MYNYVHDRYKDSDGLFWWHSIQMPDGSVTPGVKTLETMQTESNIIFAGIDLHTKTVLDLGAWNGGFSIEAFKRGAARVVALDYPVWHDPVFRGIETIHKVKNFSGYNLEIAEMDLDLPALDLSVIGNFDISLFLGTFYHLQDPIAATREICSITKETIVIETHLDCENIDTPAMTFYSGAELNNDASNWWGPNAPLIISLLDHYGFSKRRSMINDSRGVFVFDKRK